MGKEFARRDTPQRRLIREILRKCHDHPTAEAVYLRARAQNPTIGYGTVYRNLSVLAEEGEALRLPMPNGADRFDGTASAHGHYLCRICGCFGDMQTDAALTPALPDGFVSEGLLLIATGVCAACRDREG